MTIVNTKTLSDDVKGQALELAGYNTAVMDFNESAAYVADHIAHLPAKDAGHDLVRVPNFRIDRTRSASDKFCRRQPVTIINRKTGESIVRYVMGAGQNIERLGANGVALDYDAVDALGITSFSEIKEQGITFEVRPATGEELFYHYWNHIDVNLRMPMRHSIFGLLRGEEGKLLGEEGKQLGEEGRLLGIKGVQLGWLGAILGIAGFATSLIGLYISLQ